VTAAAVAAGLVVLGVPVTTLALTGTPGAVHPAPSPANSPENPAHFQAGRHSVIKKAAGASAPAATGYHAYVSLAGGSSVAELDTATDTIIADNIPADSTEGVAVTPDGSQVFAAETGQYHVIAVNTATGVKTAIEVGPYPQDVAVSPDGRQAYATVTGGDTGPGGSAIVAVINVSSDSVARDITVGDGPRRVVFSPDGSRAYVTTDRAIAVIDTATGTVVRSIPDSSGPQGITVSPDGRTLYVTHPGPGTVWTINAATGRITASIAAGAEPYSVAVTPDGSKAFVADMNSDTVAVISTATDR